MKKLMLLSFGIFQFLGTTLFAHEQIEEKNESEKFISFDLLPEDSFVRQLAHQELPCTCKKNIERGIFGETRSATCHNCIAKDYYLPKLLKNLYCSSVYNKELNTIPVDEKSLDEILACKNCKGDILEKSWQEKNYKNVCCLIRNLGEDFFYNWEMIVKEQKAFINLMEELNEPVKKRIIEWKNCQSEKINSIKKSND